MSIPPGHSTRGPAPDARLVTLSSGVFRLLLVCYPRTFREAFGHDMAVVFRDAGRAAYRRGRSGALLGLWRVALPDLLIAAAQERRKLGIQMSRQGLLRFSALSLLVAGAAQGLFAIIQVAFYTDYAVSPSFGTGGAVMDSPWIGRGAVAISVSPTALVLLLIGMVGLHQLGNRRLGALGWIAITMVVLGLAVEIGGGAVSSAVSWNDLSQCLDPRVCGVSDSTGLYLQARFAGIVGVLVAGIGFVLYGLALMRSRLLPRGNGLPVLFGVASIQPALILIAGVITRTYDMRWWSYAYLANGLESLLVVILIILFSRTLLRARPVVATAKLCISDLYERLPSLPHPENKGFVALRPPPFASVRHCRRFPQLLLAGVRLRAEVSVGVGVKIETGGEFGFAGRDAGNPARLRTQNSGLPALLLNSPPVAKLVSTAGMR